MNSAYLHCLIGLQCQFSKVSGAQMYLIIDVKPESDTLIVLNGDGSLQYTKATSIFLAESSHNKLVEKIVQQNRRGLE